MMKKICLILLLMFGANTVFAQIGYQVSLLNSASGQPRAGETVTVDIKLTNCENTEVYTTRQKATSNDFGVLSLSVGDAQTFENLDWNKLPLYIEVSIDGVLIAKSQVLNVPVAEYAKKSGFVLTREFLASKIWKSKEDSAEYELKFHVNGTIGALYTFYYSWDDGRVDKQPHKGFYYIYGNMIVVMYSDGLSHTFIYIPEQNKIVSTETTREGGIFE
ncbi:MAG: hypothetical protein IJE15_04130 [Bacteroidaceae bacterium]|nr:hypothetical protein [Bacteroidaceae bacterium]